MTTGWFRRRFKTTLAVAAISTLVCSAQRCPDLRDRALSIAEDAAAGLLDEIGAEGWRVHVYPRLGEFIDGGSIVASFSLTSTEIPAERLVCPERCVLFFFDTQPRHHFAHPAVIVLVDVDDMTVVGAIGSQWWPTVDGRSVLDTVEQRRRRDLIVTTSGLVPPIPPDPPSWNLPGAFYSLDPHHEARNVYAVIVNGFEDEQNTFDTDTTGMYNVVRGLGVPDGNIQVLRPPRTVANPDGAGVASPANLKAAFERVSGQTCDEFLYFHSSHGAPWNLACGTDPDHAADSGGPAAARYVSANDLLTWMNASVAHCGNVTVVIEACHSGSILDHFLNEPGLGDGRFMVLQSGARTPWQMYVSARSDGTSAEDVDTDDDTNVADSGSESIWGYIEAFGTDSADADDNGWVDFSEAVAYAKEMDATGGGHEGVSHISDSSVEPVAVHGSKLVRWRGLPAVEICGDSASSGSTFCAGELRRGCRYTLGIKVANGATAAAMPLALRIFQPDPDADWTPHFDENADDRYRSTTVMLPGLAADGILEVETDFGMVTRAFKRRDDIRVQAMIDHLQPPTLLGGGYPTPAPNSAKDERRAVIRSCFLDVCLWLSPSFCPD